MNLSPPFPAFAALLLAGGQSRRMGQDKAALDIAGTPLWQRQLAKLQALEPAEIFISGPRTGPYAQAGVEIVADAVPGRGPLGGLEAVLRRAHSPWVLVLAVDLPDVPVPLLAQLLERAHRLGCGAVPQGPDRFEPLAAVYPRAALSWVQAALRGSDLSLQRLVETLIVQGLVAPWLLADSQRPLFRNLNTPADLSAFLLPAQMPQRLEDRR